MLDQVGLPPHRGSRQLHCSMDGHDVRVKGCQYSKNKPNPLLTRALTQRSFVTHMHTFLRQLHALDLEGLQSHCPRTGRCIGRPSLSTITLTATQPLTSHDNDYPSLFRTQHRVRHLHGHQARDPIGAPVGQELRHPRSFSRYTPCPSRYHASGARCATHLGAHTRAG